MSKNAIRSLLSVAAPIAGTLLFPGIGTALGLGAGGLGVGGEGLAAIGGGLGGAAGGAINGGGLGGALKGGALGAAGGYLGSGGASDLIGGTGVGNALGLSTPEGGSLIGNAIGSSTTAAPGAGLFGSLLSGSGSADTSSLGGSGIDLGSTKLSAPNTLFGNAMASTSPSFAAPSTLASAPSAGIGGGASSFGSALSSYGIPLAGAANSLYANSQAQKDLLKSQKDAMGVLQPYLNSGQGANDAVSSYLGTNPNGTKTSSADILAASPGYQFQLDQGNQALQRQEAASGNLNSGAAMKEAEKFGQGLANTTGQQYLGNLLTQSGQGLSAANSAGNIFGNTGSAKANAGISSANITNQALSSLLTGSGAKKAYNIGGQVVYL